MQSFEIKNSICFIDLVEQLNKDPSSSDESYDNFEDNIDVGKEKDENDNNIKD